MVNILDIFSKFPTRKDCIDYLEKVRWNGRPRCPYCGSNHNVPMQDRHHCYTCKTSFRVTVGTLFHRTHLPLQKWFLAIHLMLNAPKRISALQLARDLEVNKNTACRIHLQIRKAMTRARRAQAVEGGGRPGRSPHGRKPPTPLSSLRGPGLYGIDWELMGRVATGPVPTVSTPQPRVLAGPGRCIPPPLPSPPGQPLGSVSAIDTRKIRSREMRRKVKPLKVIAGEPYRPLFLADMEMSCYVLEDETRVLIHKEMFRSMGYSGGGAVEEIPVLLASRIVAPFLTKDIFLRLQSPVLFKNPDGRGNVYGYPADIILGISKVLVDADEKGALGEGYALMVQRCRILLNSFSPSAIIALVDEATGYREMRLRRALVEIIERYLPPEWHSWAKIFPEEFFLEMFRLQQWNGPEDVKRPYVIARYINDLVFRRLARGVLKDLVRKNPTQRRGAGTTWDRQWLSNDFGQLGLRDHLLQVMALMRGSSNWRTFHRSLERAFPVEPT